MHGLFFLRISLDLEDFEHEIFHILPGRLVSLVLEHPLCKVLLNLFLHIAHVETRTADGEGGERNLSHRLGRALQRGHHLGVKF